MIWKIVIRILREHVSLHLIIPLLVGSFFNAMVAHFLHDREWRYFLEDVFSRDNVVFAAGVVLTYLLIMYRQTKKETSMTIRGNELAVLEEELSTSSAYFATGAISLKEWFDPISQVFLSNVIGRKLTFNSFRDERVLLFESNHQMEGLEFQYLDGYYAERLLDIHINYGTSLAFLEPSELRELIKELSNDTKNVLWSYSAWYSRMPEWLVTSRPFRAVFLLEAKSLDFAFLTHCDGHNSVLLVSKKGENLRIKRVDTSRISAYEEVVKLIRRRIYMAAGLPNLNAEHDFARYYRRIVYKQLPPTGTSGSSQN